MGHGVFTYHLLEALNGKAVADVRGFITLGAVSDYVSRAVIDWVRRNKVGSAAESAQRPWFEGPIDARDMPLAVSNEYLEQHAPDLLTGARTAQGQILTPEIEVEVKQELGKLSGQKLVALLARLAWLRPPTATGVTDFVRWWRGGRLPPPLSPPPPPPPSGPGRATKDQPWQNSLGMKFVPVAGTEVLFSAWETRLQDFDAFVKATKLRWEKPSFGKRLTFFGKSRDFELGPTHPVCGVSWEDAQAFAKWLTERERKEGKLTSGQNYRLPQDWEWSVAVGLNEPRAGTPKEKAMAVKDVFPWGKQWPPPVGAGNYNQALKVDEYENTSPVGSFTANAFGLYDMGGNVWQWCEDGYDPSTQKSRVLRGASFNSDDRDNLLSAGRKNIVCDFRYEHGGFRLVLVGALP